MNETIYFSYLREKLVDFNALSVKTALIKFRSNDGFEVEEPFFQLAFNYIKEQLLDPRYSFSHQQKLLVMADIIVDGANAGFMTLPWDNHLSTSSDVQMMIELLQRVKALVQAKGNYISVEEMQAVTTQDDHWLTFMDTPFKVCELVKLFEGIIAVLQGEWPRSERFMLIEYA